MLILRSYIEKSGPCHGELSLKQCSCIITFCKCAGVLWQHMSCGWEWFVYYKLLLADHFHSLCLMRRVAPLTSNDRVNLMANSNNAAFKSDSWARMTLCAAVRQSSAIRSFHDAHGGQPIHHCSLSIVECMHHRHRACSCIHSCCVYKKSNA